MKEVHVPLRGDHSAAGFLVVPANARALVLFAHGTGSGRHSVRNRFVADILDGSGIGTLLLDLIPEHEGNDAAADHSDIPLLADRLVDATQWVHAQPEMKSLRLGYYGGSIGAAAAFVAASELHSSVGAIVSRGGRPDLAGAALARVIAPTLLIAGENDAEVIDVNTKAAQRLGGPHELAIVPHAGHFFEEPGALADVARRARDWFATHLN